MTKRYAEGFKRQLVYLNETGISVADLCQRHAVARSTLHLWIKQYTKNDEGIIPREVYLMRKEMERLRTENAIFKVCGCSPASPLAARLSAIDAQSGEFSVHALCRVLQDNRSTYYHHLLRAPDQTQVQLEDDRLKPVILEIFEKSGLRFGARKIRVKLAQEGHAVSERRILRLMKELDLAPQKKCSPLNSANDRQYQYYPNKLKRQFLADAPNKVWVSDITYAKVGSNFLYLCIVIDLYARKVVAYGISARIDTALTAETFERAFSSRGKPTGLLFHSDQGAAYTSFAFRALLRRRGVTQSFSAPGTPHDNAVAESFFASIKKEDFRRTFYQTQSEFQQAVDAYILFYNDYRPHQRLGFLTPNQVETAFAAQEELT